ncbi:MAG: hypothetical protein ACO3IB_06915, partial [Phycisphaerales bacterium]
MANRLMTVASPLRPCLAAAGIAFVLFAAACGDPALEKQAAFEKSYKEIAAKYTAILGTNPDLASFAPSDESMAALSALASQVRGLSGGTSAQQQAAQTLASSIHRTAGIVAMSKATSLEAQQAVARDMVLAASILADDLEAIAAASSGAVGAARGDVQQVRDDAAAEGRAAESDAGALAGPARTQAKRISDGTARLGQLAQEAAVLVRKARESSPSAGLAFVEEAAKIRTEARTVQLEVAAAEAASMQTSTELAVANAVLEGARSVESAADEALKFLSDYETGISQESGRSKALAGELRSKAEAMLRTLGEQRSGAIKSAYDAAIENFSAAQQGGSGGSDAQALANAITVDEIRMARAQVEAIGAQARLLASVSAKSDALGEAKTAAEAAIATLKEKATAASDALAAAGEDPAMAEFKKFVDGAKKDADAMTVESLVNPPKPAETKASRPSASRTGRTSGGGASEADLDALVSRLNAAEGSMDAAKLMADAMDDSTPAGKSLKALIDAASGMFTPLTDAIEEKLGADAANSFAAAMASARGGA